MIINFQYPNLPVYQRDKTVNDVNRLIMAVSMLFIEVKRFSIENINSKQLLLFF
jgi:hypothetical protein